MSTPGFFAESSRFKKSKDYHFLKHLEQAEMSINPAQIFTDWSMLRHGPVFAFSSDFCPAGQESVVVKTGGEWGFTPIEYRVECRLNLLQLA